MSLEFKDRFLQVLENTGCSKSGAAVKLKVSPAYITQLCSGLRSPSDRTISDICRVFGCNEIWLRTGEGEPFQEESRQEAILRFATQTIKGSDEFRKSFVYTLSQLDSDDWQALSKLFRKLSDSQNEK